METNTQKQIVIEKLIEKGYTKAQAEGFVSALQDTDLARQVNELTTALIAVVAADVALETFL